MSFLTILAPVGTFSDLLKDIRKQIEVGWLETRSAHPLLVKNPTRELNRLVDIFEAELKIFCHRTALLSLQNSDSWQVDGNVHVFCIQKNDAGGAVWADLIRESNVDGNRLLRCGDGKLKAGNGRGGVYLVLYHREIR